MTEEAVLDDLIDIDNSPTGGAQPTGFALLNHATRDLDGLAGEARRRGKRVRALGSAWALTDIAATDGWLVNMKALNGCFDISDKYFESGYPPEKRPYVALVQAGMSVAELNTHLELTAPAGFRRSLKTAGIGAGQTIAGAVSGNTHGSAINFGAMPDFVIGLQIVTGSGKNLWLERGSQPVLNVDFVDQLNSRLIRDDDIFDAAVVSFGAFGIITAVLIETDPVYQLKFPKVLDIGHTDLKYKLSHFDFSDPPELYHYEFIFDPYSRSERAMEATGTRVACDPCDPLPHPLWIVRGKTGVALGDRAAGFFLGVPLVPPRRLTAFQFEQYRNKAILSDVCGTPGQMFTATVTYWEGYTESAVGVSINDAATMMEISSSVIRQMRLPAISQVRLVHCSRALLGFTYLGPKTAVFEFGLKNNSSFRQFENKLTDKLTAAGIGYTLHWSKNAGINPQRLRTMYGEDRIARWREARRRLFDDDQTLMRVFENDHLVRAGLH